MSRPTNDYVYDLIELSFDFDDLCEDLFEKISEPFSDRSNPHFIQKDVVLLDEQFNRTIHCDVTFKVTWIFYNSYKRGLFREEVPGESWYLAREDIECTSYDIVDISNILTEAM